jgi:uncharacterized protein
MPNRLLHEKSPYLLQHANNPVDWYPWGEEAFRKAQAEEKPIFLSIGYATCHWCHVMAHESFEDQEVAQLLNRFFVPVKVDREERPDVDQIYMAACQALTGRGGWPLSIFMTPRGKPFFAGTYFPKRGRLGMSGFMELLTQISTLWEKDQARVLKAGDEVTQGLQSRLDSVSPGPPLTRETLELAYQQFSRTYDSRWGGFGKAPKFPTPHHLTFLLRWQRRSGDPQARLMVEKTLRAMRYGGMFDQIGLGFHRYSVDEKWLVPHFEKMLYDQALLAMAYSEAFQVFKDPFYAQVAREIFTYALRDMTSDQGGFFSAEDADSEGREGLFYVWRPEEISEHLGADRGRLFCSFYGITAQGNFEDGWSIPHSSWSLEEFSAREKMNPGELEAALKEAREILFQVREKRIHPLKDDKILTAWNGLMIAALAKGAQALGEESYARAAQKAADFILKEMRTPAGGLYRRYRKGAVAYPGYLDDYAFFIWGLIELYEATFEVRYLRKALNLNRILMDLFWDEGQGGFYFTARDSEGLIGREKDLYDGASPSGNSVAALNLLRLARLSGDTSLEEKADRQIRAFSKTVGTYPMAYTQFLQAADFLLGPSQEIIIAGNRGDEAFQEMIGLIHRTFLPNKVLLWRPPQEDAALLELAPFLKDMPLTGKGPSVLLCEQYTCKTPITDLDGLQRIISDCPDGT